MGKVLNIKYTFKNIVNLEGNKMAIENTDRGTITVRDKTRNEGYETLDPEFWKRDKITGEYYPRDQRSRLVRGPSEDYYVPRRGINC